MRLRPLRSLPLNPRAVWSVAQEVRTAVAAFRPLVVAGAAGPASAVRAALAAGGDPDAVRDATGRPLAAYDLDGADVLLLVVAGDAPSVEDEEAVALARRKRVPVVCVLVGGEDGEARELRGVEPEDVILARAGEPLPVERVVERIAERAGEEAYVLASKLPVLRRPVAEAIVRRFAKQNAVLGAAVFIPGADLPALTLNQIRMVFRIAGAYGAEIDRERAVELLAVVGAGLGFRAVARQVVAFVPGPGWALKGGIAYGGTRALGRAAIRYFESVRSRS